MIVAVEQTTVDGNKYDLCLVLAWHHVWSLIRSEEEWNIIVISFSISPQSKAIINGDQGCLYLEEIDEEGKDAPLDVVDFRIVKERERDVVEEAAQANAAQECETRKRKVFIYCFHNSPLISIW